jgi:DNA-damage-inducible protein J
VPLCSAAGGVSVRYTWQKNKSGRQIILYGGFVMGQTNISISVDEDIKKEAEILCAKIGLSLSAVTNVFYWQFVRTQGIPFPVTAAQTPPRNQTRESVLSKGREALREAQARSVLNGTSEMTLDEINAIITECRQERKPA